MSLLADIQSECVSENGSVSRLLRLCLQLSARLKHAPLKEWVLHELNGYPEGADLPTYRQFETRSRGFFFDRWIGQATLDIPIGVLPEPLRDKFKNSRLDQPIRQYEELLSGDGDDTFQLPWPQELALTYGSKVSPMQCLRAWQELPRNGMAGMIDTVKTRVLSMVLDIEAENPAAGEIPGSVPSIPEAKVAQIFNTNIYGGQVQNLAAGSQGVVQSASNNVIAGDADSLKRYLKLIGVKDDETVELITALESDRVGDSVGIGKRTSEWLGKIAKQTADASGEIGKQTLIGLATQAVLAYLGIGA